MRLSRILPVLLLQFFVLAPSSADDRITVGNDAYLSGNNTIATGASSRDAFFSGFNVDVQGRVEKDLHAAGFDVDVNAPVAGDSYAAGFSVDVTEPVGDDFTAAGCNIYLRERAAIGGNARITGCSIVIDSPVSGSLTAATGDLTLNGVIAGDALITVNTMKFGSSARINGNLTYHAREPIAIPAAVIAPERVRFQKIEVSSTVEQWRRSGERNLPMVWPSFLALLSAFALTILFLVLIAAVLSAFMPRQMALWKGEALAAPIKTLALGVLGLSMSVGLVPVSAMTLVGIPLIPFAMLLILVLWIVGYIVGAYALTSRLMAAFPSIPDSMGGRIVALAAVVTILALLNFIPVIGWLINLAVLFAGLGAMVMKAARDLTRQEPHVDQTDTINPNISQAEPAPPATRRRRRQA